MCSAKDVTEMSENELFDLRRQIGMSFRKARCVRFAHGREKRRLSAMKRVMFADDEIERRGAGLSFVELERTVDMFPAERPGGMRRRVAIARAIVTQPEICSMTRPPADWIR